ncbi:hypothetical protein PsorP6_003124 [Peronosclerospora sorghi]|uniref:Uncharacterized protein n=1 Tax=Peronosclerospora sorghi TaxID=230839 RepID=A0ACC0VPK6_9STRA|nr:hypothetical protein PsorP6_003124 [Peronosclerospora sorghi]
MVAAVSMSVSATTRVTRKTTRPSPSASNPTPSHLSSTTATTQRRRPRAAGPLKGVVAMVDVRVGSDAQIDCSDVVSRKLRELGASTVKRMTPKVTHIVLSHFSPGWKTKITKWQAGGGSMAAAATRYQLKIVSQLWVNACYVSHKNMDERPFFPVSQHHVVDTVGISAKLKRKRRQSMEIEAFTTENSKERKQETSGVDGDAAASTVKPLNVKKRKRRAMSMEPMTSDAILRMLGTTEQRLAMHTPEQPIRSKRVSSSAKRRKTLNGPPTQQDQDEGVSVSETRELMAKSEPEKVLEKEESDHVANECLTEDNARVTVSSPSTPPTETSHCASLDHKGTSQELTAQELRCQNRNSLSYGSGLTLQSGIWSCAVCGCSNPRTWKHCTDCKAVKGSATSPNTEENERVAPSTVTSTVEGMLEPPAPRASAPATPRSTTPSATPTKANAPSSACKLETPHTKPLRPSVTRPTASSAAKARHASPAPPSTKKPQHAVLLSSHSKQRARSSLATASISIDVAQSAEKKRARSVAALNSIVTPVVKKARHGHNKEGGTVDKHMATPGSVSGFLRKRPDVDSTPIPLAMTFSSTMSRKTPRLPSRKVIGITGVSTETRRALQCAIHVIDAATATGVDHRKARVVKSVDYAAGVTHLIVGKNAKRTLKVLFAIARGAWLVSEDWAFSSLEHERWLPEEEFELDLFARKGARDEPDARQVFKHLKVFVGSHVEPPRDVLQSLVQVAGGEVGCCRFTTCLWLTKLVLTLTWLSAICNQISVADICICGDGSLYRRAQRMGIRVVPTKVRFLSFPLSRMNAEWGWWVFDSIASMQLEDEGKYKFPEDGKIQPARPSGRVAASGLEVHSSVP